MATTTYREIRTWAKAAIRAATPSLLPGLAPFEAWPAEDLAFEAWADASPSAAFRRFHLRNEADVVLVPPHDLVGYLVQQSLVVLVAYPIAPAMYGDEGEADADDVILSDLFDLERAIGESSYRVAWPAGMHGCAFQGSLLDERAAVRVLSLRFQLTYNRSVPT